jgi:hypothetical protein
MIGLKQISFLNKTKFLSHMLNIHVAGNYVPSFGILRTNTTQAHFYSKHMEKNCYKMAGEKGMVRGKT